MPHGAAAAHLAAIRQAYEVVEGDRLMLFASPGFDASVEQLLAYIPGGAALVMRGAAHLGTREWTESIRELGLTLLDMPTAFWRHWVADFADVADGTDLPELPYPMRKAFVGGEEMPAESVRAWSRTPLAAAPLINGYGPTETVITATLHTVRPEDGNGGPVSIGHPIPGRSAWVLDRAGNLQPVGIPGELCLAGPLARGYLGRPDVTAERFVPTRSRGARGAHVPDRRPGAAGAPGVTLEFLGRIDAQVKVRGFRIEPGEIETVLAQHPTVSQAVVIAREDRPGDKQLIGYIVAHVDRKAEPATVRGFVAERLPDDTVPSAVMVLDKLPLTVNGKLDKRALPDPSSARRNRCKQPEELHRAHAL